MLCNIHILNTVNRSVTIKSTNENNWKYGFHGNTTSGV